MASLTHVRMWTEKNGWERVTAAQAAAIFPRGTISAKSGLFVCDLCGQYVTLTDGDIRDRYFKHSAYEDSKDCPERTFGSGYSISSKLKKVELPIKITDISKSKFYFEIGFLYVPIDILNKQKSRFINIYLKEDAKPYKYSFDRLNEKSVTYLSVGNIPSNSYRIECDESLHKYWPEIVTGIDAANGSVFDGKTHIKLAYNADVKVGEKYLVLRDWPIEKNYEFIQKSLLSKMSDANRRTWYLYEVDATENKEEAVRFFLKLHCRLTDIPLTFQPLWPVYNAEPCVVRHNSDQITIHVRGDNDIKIYSFPGHCETYGFDNDGQIIKVDCMGKNQLLTAGRTLVMQYLYIWEDPIDYNTEPPNINVLDKKGRPVAGGVSTILPYKNFLIVNACYDGKVVVFKGENVEEKFVLTANKSTEISGLKYGCTVKVYQGLDEIWSIYYLKEQKPEVDDDDLLLKKLENFTGQEVKISHSFGAVIERIGAYPKTQRWVYRQVQRGYISAYALSYLKRFIDEKSGI